MNNRDFERASDLEERWRQDAIADHARAMAAWEGKTVADSAECCAVCEDPIPQGRREAWPGIQTCVACQEDLDLAASRF